MSRWLWTAELWTPVVVVGNIYHRRRWRGAAPARRRASADRFQERLELLGPRRVSQLPQRLRFDLPDPLAGDVEGPADLLQRVLGPVAHAEPHLQDLFLAGSQRLQDPAGLILEVGDEHGLDGGEHAAVLDEVPQMRILFLADRRLERDRLLGDLHDLAHLGDRHVHALGDLFGIGLAAELLDERARGAGQLVDRLDHVDRNADGPGLVRDRAGDRLADPQRRVGRELVAAAVLELLGRLHQADVHLLDQVEEL